MINKFNFLFKPYWKFQVSRLLSGKIPNYLAEPLYYIINNNLVNLNDLKKFESIETLRKTLAERGNESIEIYYSPKPSSSGNKYDSEVRPEHGEVKKFSLKEIAYHTSLSQHWGIFLYLLAKNAKAKTILELGACAGISGCYLSASDFCENFITVEASKGLADIANSNLKAISNKSKVYNMLFDEALDLILPELKHGIDLAWIDGHHEKVATIHYFQRLIPYLNNGALVIFDDISWSYDMREAWEILNKWNGFSFCLDIKTLKGVCIWHGNPKIKPAHSFVAKPLGKIQIGKPKGW
jgi:predicted O-methyltransferase YrrM